MQSANLALLEELREHVELHADGLLVVVLVEQVDHLLGALKARHHAAHEDVNEDAAGAPGRATPPPPLSSPFARPSARTWPACDAADGGEH